MAAVEIHASSNPDGSSHRVVWVRWKDAVIIISVNFPADHHLTKVARALNSLRLLLGLGQGGQKHCRENRNDGNDYQQLDKRECRSIFSLLDRVHRRRFQTAFEMIQWRAIHH